MMDLYKKLKEATEITPEMEQFFLDRTGKHVRLVQQAARHIESAYPDEFRGLAMNTDRHDASKYVEPERTPYVKLIWEKKHGIKSDDADITQATLHHVLNNAHHPEHHNQKQASISKSDRDKSDHVLGASAMPDMDIAEMVADWQAMSEELGTNTAREWYDKQRNVRWKFTPEQEKLIDRLLKVFEGGKK